MRDLHIVVNNKIATYMSRDGNIVCGNSDYRIVFTFDSEWAGRDAKVARFIWNNKYLDVAFAGDTVTVPIISGATLLKVGVYAGELHTTTPATINCTPSILCEHGTDEEAQHQENNGKIEYRLPLAGENDEGKILAVEGGAYVLKPTEEESMKKQIAELEKEVADLTEKSNKFDAWYDETHYVKMTGTFTATNGGETVEIGSTINSIFTWSFSKLPTSLTVGGVKQTPPTQEGTTTQQAFTASSQTSKSFTISGVYAGAYGNETVSKTWTYQFQNKRYWGYVEVPATLDGDFIKSLTGEFATSRGKTLNLNDSTSGKYIWYAYPTRFGKASFTIGGFAGGFEEPDTISVTNGAGYTENYYLYRSTNAGVGALKVIVE